MKIQFINNSNSNKSNPNFKHIYRIQVNRNLFEKATSEISTKPLKEFNKIYNLIMLNVLKDVSILSIGLKKVNLSQFSKLISNIKKESNSSMLEESLSFTTFQGMKESTGYGPWWLARHLGIEEPTPKSDTHHTFFVFTGDDNKKIGKLNSFRNILKITRKTTETLEDKISKGEIKDYDAYYWNKIIYSEKTEKMFNDIISKQPIQDITINTPSDLLKIYQKNSDAILDIKK